MRSPAPSSATEPSFPPLPTRARAARLRQRLLDWYGSHARDLPWRRTRDAYAIWISEAMLQQTRVETVIDYYKRFLARFPDAAALAGAPEEDVLTHWSGLGYYRRARSLHAAARVIADEHAGRFPSDHGAALALPGVGKYTAGAVLSIAYDQPRPLVDGNVERVFARLFGLDAASGSKDLVDHCWSLAQRLVPARGAGDWNQALMELGALVCTPRQTSCGDCPLRRSCRARAQDRVAELPRPKPRPAALALDLELLLVERKGAWLLEQRPPTGAMAGLWQFPTRSVLQQGAATGARPTSTLFPPAWTSGLEPSQRPDLGELRHSITRFAIRARLREGRLRGALPARMRWIPCGELGTLPLTGMTKKALRRLMQGAEPVE